MPAKKICEWLPSEGYDEDYWSTSCGHDWCFIDGGPKENDCRFCPYCGGRLVVRSKRRGR